MGDGPDVVDLFIVPPDDYCIGLTFAINAIEEEQNALIDAVELMKESGLEDDTWLLEHRVQVLEKVKCDIQSEMQDHISGKEDPN